MEELATALADKAWPRALELGIAAWREHRATALADLVDAIAARCAPPLAPRSRNFQAWWIAQARVYDPVVATTLAAHAWTENRGRGTTWPEVVVRWGAANPVVAKIGERGKAAAGAPLPSTWPHHANWTDRLAALFAWPDDPRTGMAIADCRIRGVLAPYFWAAKSVHELLHDKLVALRDVRALRHLASRLEARGHPAAAIAQARTAADAVEQQLAPLPEADAARVAAWTAELRAVPPAIDVDALWREVAAQPRQLGPRLVLADALTQLGDTRGELIALQCGRVTNEAPPGKRDRAERKAMRLVQDEWSRWFGDLAHVVTRRSELVNGMLEAIAVGQPGTPAWAWAGARRHRELACVLAIRPVHAAAADYAAFVADFVHAYPGRLSLLGIDSCEVIDLLRRELPALGIATLDVRAIEYSQSNPLTARYRRDWPPLTTTFESLALLAPELAWLDVRAFHDAAQLGKLAPRLPALFPQLRTVRVTTGQAERMRDLGDLLELA